MVDVWCAQSLIHVQLYDPTDCSPLGSSVHGIFQAGILEWVAVSFSRGSSRPRDWTHVSCIGRQVLHHWAIREAPYRCGVLSNKGQKTSLSQELEAMVSGTASPQSPSVSARGKKSFPSRITGLIQAFCFKKSFPFQKYPPFWCINITLL